MVEEEGKRAVGWMKPLNTSSNAAGTAGGPRDTAGWEMGGVGVGVGVGGCVRACVCVGQL